MATIKIVATISKNRGDDRQIAVEHKKSAVFSASVLYGAGSFQEIVDRRNGITPVASAGPVRGGDRVGSP